MTRRGNHEGHVAQWRGRWRGQVQVPDPITGQSRRVSVYGKTRAEATRKMREVVRRSEQGNPLTDSAADAGEYLTQWASERLPRSNRRPATVEQYQTLLRVHVVPKVTGTRLDRLRPQHVRQIIDGMDRSPSTKRSTYAALRAALADAVRDGLLASNPVESVDRPHREQTEATVLSAEQVRSILAAAEGHRLYPLLVVLAFTGLRRGEALAVRWQDISDDTLTVTGTLSRRTGQGLVVSRPKTKAGRRSIALPQPVVTALADHRRAQAAERLAAGPAWPNTGLVFTTPLGEPLDPRNVARWFSSVIASVDGLPNDVSLHTLRHSLASLLLHGGIDVATAAAVLGHSSPTITLDVYSHAVDETRRRAAETTTRALGSAT